MEQLSAIIEISILLIVAYLIGLLTGYIYWKAVNKGTKKEYEQKLSDLRNKMIEKENQREEEIREKKKLAAELEEKTKSNGHHQPNIPEPLYATIVKEMGEGISVSNHDGYFLAFNPQLEKLTGYTREEANQHKEKLFLDRIYPDVAVREEVGHHIANIPEGDRYTNIKTTITTKNHEKIPVLVSSTVVKYNDEKFYLTAYRDMSEKPKVEA